MIGYGGLNQLDMSKDLKSMINPKAGNQAFMKRSINKPLIQTDHANIMTPNTQLSVF